MSTIQTASLYYQEGSSDKVYHIYLNETSPGLYTVDFAYGRRGNTLQTGTKTNSPTSLFSAQSVYNNLLREKTGKGYKVSNSNTTNTVPAFTSVPNSKQMSHLQPQLLNPISESEADNYITLEGFSSKYGDIRCYKYREMPENTKVCKATFTKLMNDWYVSLSLEIPWEKPKQSELPAVGIDVGHNTEGRGSTYHNFAMLSNGEVISFVGPLREYEEKLAILQQKLAKRRTGGRNKPGVKTSGRAKDVIAQISALHNKIAEKRKLLHREIAKQLVTKYGQIYYEKLNISGMIRKPKPKPSENENGIIENSFEHNGASAKAGNNKSKNDVAWGSFFKTVDAAAEWVGAISRGENAVNTTQECCICHQKPAVKLGLSVRIYNCEHCGNIIDRDTNAAINILNRGLATTSVGK